MKQKIDIDWKKFIGFAFVIGLIYFITSFVLHLVHPLLITVGILLLLLVGDHYAQVADQKLAEKRRKKDEEKKREE